MNGEYFYARANNQTTLLKKKKKKELQLDIVQDKRKNAYSFFLNNFFPWKKKKRKATEKNTPKHP